MEKRTFLAMKTRHIYVGDRSQVFMKATPRSTPESICLPQWTRVTGIKLKSTDEWYEIEATFKLKGDK